MTLNVELLKETFNRAGFPVRVAEKQDNKIFRFEYNFPDEKSAIAMRTAMLRGGAEMMTLYKYQASTDTRGELLQRERVHVPFESDEDLRNFFNNVIDVYSQIMDERTNEASESSYIKQTRRRRALA